MKIVASKRSAQSPSGKNHGKRGFSTRDPQLRTRGTRIPRQNLTVIRTKSKRTSLSRFANVRPVRFECLAPGASSVFVAGNFNDWNAQASPLRGLKDGRWCLQLRLKPGRYEYRFLVDGVWRPDPSARQYVTDFCGGLNSVRVVE